MILLSASQWNCDEKPPRSGRAPAGGHAIGTVAEAKVVTERETGPPRGFAFVKMSTEQERPGGGGRSGGGGRGRW